MENTIKSMPDSIVKSTKAEIVFVVLKLALLANMYWLWLAIKFGSLSMFIVGVIPLAWIVTAPVSVWAFVVGVPQWVVNTFAVVS